MCGIVGYIGDQEAYPILIKSLKRLEYRGYDSAGIALINDSDELNVYKTKGKVADLVHMVESKDTTGHIGIAHTRWATHGEPNQINAHPHYSASGNLALIHNGIIENYATIKEKLQREGYAFKSCTDTEVLVQLIEYVQISHNLDLLAAVQLALHEVIGAYAIAILDRRNPDTIIAARQSSPLAIGIGKDEFFLASDASPIVEYTNRVVYLEDGEIAVLKKGEKLHVVTQNNAKVNPKINTIKLNIGQLEKGGYPHFMLKEIFEQPDCIKDCMRGRVSIDGSDIALSAIIDNKKRLLSARRFVIVACGTSWHAALIGKYLIEQFCRFPVEVEYASEFRYRNPVINENDVVIAISQSGETLDTMAALREAKKRGAYILSIVNVVGSSIARESDDVLYTWAGPEIAVATTKAYSTQLAVLDMIGLAFGEVLGTVKKEEYDEAVAELQKLPEKMEQFLASESCEAIPKYASQYFNHNSVFFIGRNLDYALGLEGSLKLKEISYIHSEAYASGELKHGTISLIEDGTLVIALGTYAPLFDKAMSNVVEVKARGADVLALATESHHGEMAKTVENVITIPDTAQMLLPSLGVVPLQLLAYYIALQRGCDIDKPRNLAKSVTVE